MSGRLIALGFAIVATVVAGGALLVGVPHWTGGHTAVKAVAVTPPAAVPTGDDATYKNAADNFNFDLYGVRVPTVVVSAYTQKGTVIGNDPNDKTTMFDHTSILATVEARFGLPALTARDKAANTLAIAVNLDNPRGDAPTQLQAQPLPNP